LNIFYLDEDARTCAAMHCDKHVCKMIVEYAQLLSTAHYVLDGKQVGYKPTHKNHPCAVWVRENIEHYAWLYFLFLELCTEYTLRYGKQHKTASLANVLENPPTNIPSFYWNDPPQCMPDDCKNGDTVEAYRKLYLTHKKHFVTYKLSTPEWFTKGLDIV